MKHRLLFTIAIITTVGILLLGCGQKASEEPERSSELLSSATVIADRNSIDLVEVDISRMPEELSKEDLIMKNGQYYIEKERLTEIARSLNNEIEVGTADGKTIYVNPKGDIKEEITVNGDSGQSQKRGQTNPNSGTTASGNTASGTSSNSGNNSNGAGNTPSNGGRSNTGGNSGGFSGSNNGGTSQQPITEPPTESPTQPAHTHNYNIYVRGTPSTCIAAGSETWACSCGATNTKTLALSAHSYTPVYRQEDQGWYEDIVEYHTVCNACGAYLEGLSDMEIAEHSINCGAGYSGKNVVVGQHWVPYLVDVLDHYECSVCGARQ